MVIFMPKKNVLISTSNPYYDYHSWKGWDVFFDVSPDQAGYFEGELRDLNISGARVLEIGFGSGACLAWMRRQGAEIFGSEISEISQLAAADFGVNLIPSNLPEIAKNHEHWFDTILAFDVFEHLSIDEVREYLDACEVMLRSGGKLLLRFPNAQSPFGLRTQQGDPTHRSALSRSAIEYLIVGRSLSVNRYGAAFSFFGISPVKRMVRMVRYALQKSFSSILNFTYATRIPYEPVVVIVLIKK